MPGYYAHDLTAGQSGYTLRDEEFHHLVHVTRHAVGEEILLNNGKGLLASARIREIGKREASLDILEVQPKKRSYPSLGIAFSLLKQKNDHWLVEKLTELGIREFFPLSCQRTVQKAGKDTVEKFEKTAISAIKQCDNAFLPTIHPVRTLPEAITHILNQGYRIIVASENEHEHLLGELFEPIDTCLVIGPEGGFDDVEFELFNRLECETFSLGNHILRAETAAIVAGGTVMQMILRASPGYY